MTQPAAEQLLNLANRAERHALTPDEAQRLRDGITALTAELATMEHVAKGNKAHVQAIVPELEAATTRAEQLEDLLRIANDTSNTSEAERARAVERANRAEGERGDLLVKLAAVREDRDRWRDQAKTEQADRRDAEAAIERARAELHALNSEVRGLNPVALAGRRDAVARILAALDEHQEQPLPTPKEN